MKRFLSMPAAVVLWVLVGCANVAGINDFKKEGEGGKALNATCAEQSECGAGLSCANNTCLRNCYDLANPAKVCGIYACFPLDSGESGVCFPGTENKFGSCANTFECAPGFLCVEITTTGGGGQCVPYCHGVGDECAAFGGTACRATATSIVVDGVTWGFCGPTGASSGGNSSASGG